jgi:sigma-B regulation protein RsbU (phosphoserine phosphatase)
VALFHASDGATGAHPPADVAARLNRISLAEMATDTYFTMVYAEIDLATGAVRLVQAGHPHPLVQRRGGRVEQVGAGGVPIGLIEEAPFTEVGLSLAPGDRLLLISDGITECENRAGQMLEEPGLERIVIRNAGLSGQGFLEALTWDLATHADSEEFGDDISAVLFEYGGPETVKLPDAPSDLPPDPAPDAQPHPVPRGSGRPAGEPPRAPPPGG